MEESQTLFTCLSLKPLLSTAQLPKSGLEEKYPTWIFQIFSFLSSLTRPNVKILHLTTILPSKPKTFPFLSATLGFQGGGGSHQGGPSRRMRQGKTLLDHDPRRLRHPQGRKSDQILSKFHQIWQQNLVTLFFSRRWSNSERRRPRALPR